MKKEQGFIQLIIIIVIALLLMKYFGLTFSGILDYFGVTVSDLGNWLKKAMDWFKELFTSVAK